MMKNRTYFLLMTAFCIITFAMISGCGKYAAQYSAPIIISRYPALGADGIGSAEALWVKFSKRMDTSGTSFNELINKIVPALDNKATIRILAGITPESFWIEDDTKLVITKVFFVASPEGRVHILASREAFKDLDDLKISENATLWDFTLSGLTITNRFPTLDAADVPNVPSTLEITFNNPVVTSEFSATPGPLHTAGLPTYYNLYWSNSDRTLSLEVSAWPVNPAVIDITYEAVDIFGNVVKNGQLIRYSIP